MEIDAFSILSHYEAILEQPKFSPDLIGSKYKIPSFSEKTLNNLCQNAIDILEKQETLLELKTPIIAVGDLHGSLPDLLQILYYSGLPPKRTYLFLGDYVDRGSFSIETITLLFALMIAYPENIYLLRGNHESPEICGKYGFKSEIVDVYNSDELFNTFCNAFAYLPLAATIDGKYYCVHGGLSPNLNTLKQIRQIQRPIFIINHDKFNPVEDMLWSDPVEDFSVTYYDSTRGRGHIFGFVPLTYFLKENQCTIMIRGHQCVMRGVEYGSSQNVITVFSASNYDKANNNLCGVLAIEKDKNFPIIFKSIPRMARAQAVFTNVEAVTTTGISTAQCETTINIDANANIQENNVEIPKICLSECKCMQNFRMLSIRRNTLVTKQRSSIFPVFKPYKA